MFQKRIDVIREQLANIEKEMEETHLHTQPLNKPVRHGKPWLEFEKELLKTNLDELATKLARQFGRTEISILLHICGYISKGMRDA